MSTVPLGADIHPFLKGNFAPVATEFISHSCEVVYGQIPAELLGGQYIRNGGNPVYPPEKGRHYHWFDGDGMLHGVLFPTSQGKPPLYTNRHLATPSLTLTLLLLRSPIPSIALLISPLSSLHRIIVAILHAFFIALRARMGVLSVANTSVIWWGQGLGKEAEEEVKRHDNSQCERPSSTLAPELELDAARGYQQDHRLLATCESGPPLEVRLPELATVDWDRLTDHSTGESLSNVRGKRGFWRRWSLPRLQEDWMTAHPRVDPIDGSLIFYSTHMFDAPHARYSVIDRRGRHLIWKEGVDIGRAKMMHDFAATRTQTVLLNLPLTLSPANLFDIPPAPLIHFDRTLPSEFVVFPRLLRSQDSPQEPIRFTERDPSLIFHTANAWDEYEGLRHVAVNMLGCRFKSAKLVYAAGAVEIPKAEQVAGEDDVVRLHYHRFLLPSAYVNSSGDAHAGEISHSFPLSAVPFEFPTVPADMGMSETRYIYGCTMKTGSFDERLGGAAKVDCLVKIDVQHLILAGRTRGNTIDDPVDPRTSDTILKDWEKGTRGPIEIFACPHGWYAQESRFVPKLGTNLDEDDGYLLTYVYDESHLLPDGTPSTGPGTGSELWIIDAKCLAAGMSAVVCRIKLPQRVPYGLHGTWVPQSHLYRQRPMTAKLPDQPLLQDKLALSRLRAFASVIFGRPFSRDKSKLEKAILALLWPTATGLLALAVAELVWMRGDTRSHSS